MLAKRITTAVIGLPLGLYILYLGGIWVTVGVALLVILGMGEYFSAAKVRGLNPWNLTGYLAGLAFVALAHFSRGKEPGSALVFLVAWVIMMVMATPALAGKPAKAIGGAAATLTASLYVGFLFSFLIILRNFSGEERTLRPFGLVLEAGFAYAFYVVAVSWLTDTGAFFTGKSLGHRKLTPSISPGKTLEGAVGGVLTALIIGIPLGGWIGIPWIHAAALAFLGSIVGQVGDLTKSAIKRDAGMKDFGKLFPGHGGILDRFDSILFNAPVFYFYLRLMGL